MDRRVWLVAVVLLLWVLAFFASRPPSGSSEASHALAAVGELGAVGDLALFTHAYAPDYNYARCVRSVTGLRVDTDSTIAGENIGRAMLGSLRGTSNLGTVVAGFGNKLFLQDFDDPDGTVVQRSHAAAPPYSSIYIMRRRSDDIDEWDTATTVIGPAFSHGIEIMPDGDTLLVATVGEGSNPTDTLPPFRVEKYSLSEMARIPDGPDRQGTHLLGPSRGSVDVPDPAVSLVRDIDGHRVHILTKSPSEWQRPVDPTQLSVLTVDVESMTEVAVRVPLSSWAGLFGEVSLPMVALAPDGRYLATTAGFQPVVNVVDLVNRVSQVVAIRDATEVTDVAFSHGSHNHGLLALNVRQVVDSPRSRSQVVVGELRGGGFDELSRGPLYVGYMERKPSAVEWATDGSAIVAGVDFQSTTGAGTEPMVTLLAVGDGGKDLSEIRALLPCPRHAFVMDILTANGIAPPTPTPLSSPTMTPTSAPTSTLTPPVPTVTETSTTPPVTPTRPPQPIYLPVLVREECTPELRKVDLVLVIDASSTMLEHTRSGRTKLDAAIAAANMLATDLNPDRDRLGLVWFNDTAHLELALTLDRPAFRAALGRIQVRELTRIDLGVAIAHAALIGDARRHDATPVLMLLTDGRSNPGPESLAVAEATAAKIDNIIVFTVGIGDRIDAPSLKAMASSPSHYVLAPDGEDLPSAYAAVRDALPCPHAVFWP